MTNYLLSYDVKEGGQPAALKALKAIGWEATIVGQKRRRLPNTTLVRESGGTLVAEYDAAERAIKSVATLERMIVVEYTASRFWGEEI